MGRLRALVPLTLALVVTLVSSVMIYKWIQQKTQVPQSTVRTTDNAMQIALATTDLPWGTKLTPEMIKMAAVPKNVVPAGCSSDAAALEGRVLIAPLKQNEPIMESKLAPSSVTAGGVSAVVTPGKRAIAVAGDKVIGLAGFIQPGNRVDVLVTIKDPQTELQITKIVLSDILVLATGTQVDKKGGGNEPAPVDVFTLEVMPEEGERLSLAATQGKIHLALRNVTDKETVYTMGATISDTLDAYRPRLELVSDAALRPEAENAPAPAPKRSAHQVEIIKGSTVSKMSF